MPLAVIRKYSESEKYKIGFQQGARNDVEVVIFIPLSFHTIRENKIPPNELSQVIKCKICFDSR